MRELKFRAWDGDLEEYIDYTGLDIPVESLNNSNTLVWEQFTGIHDKNGKEIYEGDNIRDEAGNIAPIVWNEYDCSFIIDFEMGCEQLDFSAKDWADVIGTIHDPH